MGNQGSTLASGLKESTGVSVNHSTVRRQINIMSLKGCVAVKKPLLKRKIDRKEENFQTMKLLAFSEQWIDHLQIS